MSTEKKSSDNLEFNPKEILIYSIDTLFVVCLSPRATDLCFFESGFKWTCTEPELSGTGNTEP